MNLKKLLAVLSLTCICVIAGIFFLFMTLRFVKYSPEVCAESIEELQNPYIGWYQIYGYELSDDTPYDFSKIPEMESQSGLALLQLNLRNYADSPVSDRGLLHLDQFLNTGNLPADSSLSVLSTIGTDTRRRPNHRIGH